MTKEVCRVASCTSTSTAFEKTVLALAICCPPLDSPVWSAPPPAASTACAGREDLGGARLGAHFPAARGRELGRGGGRGTGGDAP